MFNLSIPKMVVANDQKMSRLSDIIIKLGKLQQVLEKG